jgi:hypothetical protein
MNSTRCAARSGGSVRRRCLRRPWLATSLIGLLYCCSGVVSAYVGPGSGLSAIGALFAVCGALLFGVIGLIWYPFKRLLQYLKRRVGSSGE